MSIKIRKAQVEDSPFLAQMILQSSRAEKKVGMFDLIFESKSDQDVLDNIEKLTKTTAKNHCHFSNFLIAEMDGKNVGSLCSYEPRIATREAFLDALKEVDSDNEAREFLEILDACDFQLNKRTLIFDFMEELDGYMDVGI